MAHALLSPSSASRWLACTPSARLESAFPDRSGEAAKEGTVAHALSEALLRVFKGEWSDALVDQVKIEGAEYYNPEMQRHAEAYYDFVIERFADAQALDPLAVMELETRLDLRKYVPEGFGTGDCIIVADKLLDIIDLKYGKGVLVDATDNKQMMIYALGALDHFDFIYDVERVRMTIFQPRLDNYSIFEMSVAELRSWAETELMPKAELAFKGSGEQVAGKHCFFCKAKAKCRKLAEHNLELAKHEFKLGPLLSVEEVADILGRIEMLTGWAKAVQEFALTAALDGTQFPGWKVVEGRSSRKYADPEAVAAKVLEMGWPESDVYNKSVVSLTQMEKLLGKVDMAKLSSLIIKPTGAPTLVPESDKRPAFSSAALDFS